MTEPPYNFFYAQDDADLYDATVRLTTEPYDLLHAQVARLVSYWRTSIFPPVHGRPMILDIGAGTGEQSLAILRGVPEAHLICIDLSERMLAKLREKVADEFGDETAKGRCWCIQADVRSENWLSRALATIGFSSRKAALAVSVYTLHHFGAEAKLAIYSAIADALEQRGSLIHGDLFSFDTPTLSSFAQQLEEKFIQERFGFDGPTATGLSASKVQRLVSEWLHHSRNENRPMHIYPANHYALTQINRVAAEVDILAKAGFNQVEVPFRIFQNGVLLARK